MKKIILFAILGFFIILIPRARATDATPPSVPQNLGYLYTTDNSIRLSWDPSTDFLDGPNISYVIYKDGAAVATATTIPFTLTDLLPLTTYSFTVAAKDSAGNTSAPSNAISATTQVDTVRPVTQLIFPISGALVQGIVTFTATSTDDVAVDHVAFVVDGSYYGDVSRQAPYSVNFDANHYPKNSQHTVAAWGYDAAGNVGASQTVIFTVGSNLAPMPYAISVGQITYSSALITWQTPAGVIGSVQYGSGAPYAYQVRESAPTSLHSLLLSNLLPGQTYHFTVSSELSGYATASSTDSSFVTLASQAPGGDTVPPIVNFISPSSSGSYSGMLNLQISAADAFATSSQAQSGLRAVWVTVDGQSLGGEQTFAPFNFAWNTTQAANGPHTVTAFVQDNAGNTGQSSVIYSTLNALPASTSAHPDGTLILDGTTVYLIKNGQRAPFRDSEEYKSHGYNFSQAVTASGGDKALPASATIIKALEGTLVLDKADGKTVYMVGSGATKRGFASEAAFTGLGYKFGNLLRVDMSDYQSGPAINDAAAAHPDGALVLSGQTVWWIRGQERQGFESADVFNTYGFSFANIVPANAADMALSEGPLVKFRDGTLVADGSDYYIISGGKKLKFSSAEKLVSMGYKTANALKTSLANYQDGGQVE